MTEDAAGLEADIARTRDELAQTVDELTARLEVKKRAGIRGAQVVAGGAVLALIALVVVRGWRRRH